MSQSIKKFKIICSAAVIVAALGYFVDIYDLLLFSIVRVDSLRAIGYQGRELEVGALLNNIQMTGLMLGGIAWGMLADRRGRLSVLFGSIFLYSVANFCNAFAINFTQYAFCRFFAGLGLAGELGAGITLVAEVLPTELRGYGTMVVATVGVMGAIVGGWVAQTFDWRFAFKIGGMLGFFLLVLRIGVSESAVFSAGLKNKDICRGNFLHLFTSKDRFQRFSLCILSGVPIWFTIGILVTYAPEFAKNCGITEPISTAKAVMACYLGFVFGDFASGFFSQIIKSRIKAVKLFVVVNVVASVAYLFALKGTSAGMLYFACVVVGTTAGYWAVVVTMAAEHFGTNMRATVATSVPNFIRFSLVPMSLSFIGLKKYVGLIGSALIVSLFVSIVAFIAASKLKETYSKDLNYFEKI